MTTTVEAVYQGGVFKPVGPVDLPENQRVQLRVEALPAADVLAWLEQMREAREAIRAKYGTFPDSTPDIAEDRMRDA
ncbi:MAG TPA: antitoxin family protein [Gemmataceae bacterium]|jgi:predicted DNA-binding antitoxin AbrB/MazE fold protein